MADEAVVEAQPEVAPEPTPEVATEAPPEAPPTEPSEDEGEPGGASPEDVRARKEYRTRKTVERELQSERIERIRLEERLRALETQQPQQPAKPRIFTPDEVQAEIDKGTVTHAQAAAYFAKVEAERALEEREARTKAQQPLNRAAQEVNEYMVALPWTTDKASKEFKEVAGVYYSLVNEYGLPDNIVTQRIALEKYAGPLERVKARMASDTATRRARVDDAHSEAPAGGPAPTRTDDISKAPAHMVRVWERTGTSAENRKKEYAYWKASHK